MENKIKAASLEWTTGKVNGFSGKDLLHLDKGTLKLIKVDPFAMYPEHIHPDKTEYAYVLQGCPEFIIDSKLHTSEPGDFFIFPFGKIHVIKNRTDTTCLLLIGAVKN